MKTNRKMKLASYLIAIFLVFTMGIALAQESTSILITNANIFDGTSESLVQNQDVLIEGNIIKEIGANIKAPKGAQVIDAKGATLSPGFMDIHAHIGLNTGPADMFYAPVDYHAALTLHQAEKTLMMGFTTIRDVGGAVFGVKRAIDEGYFEGPRIYAGGPPISMTAGHGDYRSPLVPPRQLGGPSNTELEVNGATIFADGVPEVLSAARRNMRSGAVFLKMFVGGAVSGMYDPLDIAEYSFEEVKAAADEADRWNTYLAVHTYTDKATQIAIKAGAKTLEHCNLITEETVKMAVENDCYISAQTGVYLAEAPASFTPAQKARQQQAADGLDNLLSLCKKHNAKLAFGSDLLMDMEVKKTLCEEFTNRTKWFSNAEIMKQATAVNGEILALSGPRNPYPGKLGVIEEGALADILLINGNPLDKIDILLDYEENLLLIMKDGKIFKNILK